MFHKMLFIEQSGLPPPDTRVLHKPCAKI